MKQPIEDRKEPTEKTQCHFPNCPVRIAKRSWNSKYCIMHKYTSMVQTKQKHAKL